MADRDPGEVLLAEVTRTRRSIAWHETEIALAMVDADTVLADKRLVGWAAERKHLADVTAKALHAGVARRTLELQEDMARQLAAVMTRYTELLGLDPGDVRVREAGRGAMQLIAGGSA
jgi:hypothetical protein